MSVFIKVSGTSRLLKAGIDLQGNAWTQIPIYSDINRIKIKRNYYIVELEGITQVVTDDTTSFRTQAEYKKDAYQILNKFALLQSQSASGVIFLKAIKQKLVITPVIWVRDIKTLFLETACGSGTAAVGLVQAIKTGNSISQEIIQPSGMNIKVDVDFDDQKFNYVKISGPIFNLGRGSVII